MIQRYNFGNVSPNKDYDDSFILGLVPEDNGMWIQHADHLRKVEELQKKIEDLNKYVGELESELRRR